MSSDGLVVVHSQIDADVESTAMAYKRIQASKVLSSRFRKHVLKRAWLLAALWRPVEPFSAALCLFSHSRRRASFTNLWESFPVDGQADISFLSAAGGCVYRPHFDSQPGGKRRSVPADPDCRSNAQVRKNSGRSWIYRPAVFLGCHTPRLLTWALCLLNDYQMRTRTVVPSLWGQL